MHAWLKWMYKSGKLFSVTRALGAWSVLRESGFRNVWVAAFCSNLGSFAQAVGAGWVMTSLTTQATLVALVQTASTLPLFLLAVPAGVLGDLVDRRGLIRETNFVLASLAAVLAYLTFAGKITPAALLLVTFAMGIASALQSPAWGALIPEIVPPAELPSAIALNGVNFNLSRVIGPPTAGLLIGTFGPAIAFALNALSFAPVVAIMRPVKCAHKLTAVAFGCGVLAIRDAITECAPVRAVLVRTATFSIGASVIFSLLPLLARTILHARSAEFGLVFGALGLGSVAVAQVLGAIRSRLGVNGAVFWGAVTLGVAVGALGFTSSLIVACVAMLVAGFGWLTVLATLNTSIQFAVPPEHRAGGFALYLLTSQGTLAFTALMWGGIAAAFGTQPAFVSAGVMCVCIALSTRRVAVPWVPGIR
jgi:MFS family permease